MLREIDIWFGIDSGQSKKIKGVLLKENSNGSALIEITDKDFLESVGHDSDDDPFTYETIKLEADRWVSYDDFMWSEIGEVRGSDLNSLGELIGKRNNSTSSLYSNGLYTQFADHIKDRIF